MSDDNKDLETGILKSSMLQKKKVKKSTQNENNIDEENKVLANEKESEQEKTESNSSVAVMEKAETEENIEKKIEEDNNVKNEIVEQQKTTNKGERQKDESNTKSQYEFVVTKTKKKDHKLKILIVLIILLFMMIALFSTVFALVNANNNNILGGIYIRGILVENLTEEEAVKLLNEQFEKENKRELILKINGEEYSIIPEQIEAKYDVEKAVQEAYSIGRNGNILQNNFEIIRTIMEESKVDIDFTYNEELLNNIMKSLDAKIPNAMVDNTYSVEDNQLIITRGVAGVEIDKTKAKEAIVSNIKAGIYNETGIEIPTIFKECPEIDIEKIHSEVKTEPQNASYKKDPFELISHKNGLDFDVEEAKKILSEEKDEYIIQLTVIEPEIHTNELGEEAFPDLLGAFSTKYDETSVSRSKNVKIAISKLNGVVVMPGEVFSYNDTLGKRTVEEGYEYASGFAGGKVVPMLGGGICQVSSTLYDAVLYANLHIVERYNHMFQVTYAGPGKDATVSYGTLDFKFENTRSYPIMIKAKASGGLAEIKIYGIKEEVEYEVELVTNILSYTPYKVIYENDSSLAAGREVVSQYGLQGCESVTYRIVKLNGQEVSKELLSKDSYDPLNKVIRRGTAGT